jgi:hypothetical protein
MIDMHGAKLTLKANVRVNEEDHDQDWNGHSRDHPL